VKVLKCHRDRTKKIATENSPFLFMTVSEDGTVRQHDLRRPHRCRAECPDPLFRAPQGVDLYSLSVSTVAPHIFAVAGRTDTVRSISRYAVMICSADISGVCVRSTYVGEAQSELGQQGRRLRSSSLRSPARSLGRAVGKRTTNRAREDVCWRASYYMRQNESRARR
jgi:hypothetical protein